MTTPEQNGTSSASKKQSRLTSLAKRLSQLAKRIAGLDVSKIPPSSLRGPEAEALWTAAKIVALLRAPHGVSTDLDATAPRQIRVGAHTVIADRRVNSQLSRVVLRIAALMLLGFNFTPFILYGHTKDMAKIVESWEFWAIISTGVVCAIVYVLDLFALAKADKLHTQPRPSVVVVLQYTCILFLLAAAVLGAYLLNESDLALAPYRGGILWHQDRATILYLKYLGCVSTCGLLFCLIDYLVGYHSKDFEESEEAAISQTFASFPAAVSFFLLGFVGLIFVVFQGSATREVRLFFGGAAAFQMLISNLTFLAIKSRKLFQRIGDYCHNVVFIEVVQDANRSQ
jgi:hypothetical protein